MRYKSTVRWFRNKKGFGFLRPVDGVEGDIAIHHTSVERRYKGEFVELEEGDLISFEVEYTVNGARAVNARREAS